MILTGTIDREGVSQKQPGEVGRRRLQCNPPRYSNNPNELQHQVNQWANPMGAASSTGWWCRVRLMGPCDWVQDMEQSNFLYLTFLQAYRLNLLPLLTKSRTAACLRKMLKFSFLKVCKWCCGAEASTMLRHRLHTCLCGCWTSSSPFTGFRRVTSSPQLTNVIY